MEFLTNYGLFLAKTVTFLIAVFVVITMIVSAGLRNKSSEKGQIHVNKLNEKFKAMREALQHAIFDEEKQKQLEKDEKKKLKEEKAEQKKLAKQHKNADVVIEKHKKRVFVLDFVVGFF